jgi:hypothetical protein
MLNADVANVRHVYAPESADCVVVHNAVLNGHVSARQQESSKQRAASQKCEPRRTRYHRGLVAVGHAKIKGRGRATLAPYVKKRMH